MPEFHTQREYPQAIPLQGAYNVRDLGGHPTADGRQTRSGVLIRADSLHAITPDDQAMLLSYGLRTVFDLRGDDDVIPMPNVFEGSSAVDYRRQDMMGSPLIARQRAEPGPKVGSTYLIRTYRRILDVRRDRIAQTVAMLARPESRPALFHCQGGKDRTGILTALLLSMVGVADEYIAADYALSARFLIKMFLEVEAPPAYPAASYSAEQYEIESCPPEVMLWTLHHLRDRYGGIDEYLLAGDMTPEGLDLLRGALLE